MLETKSNASLLLVTTDIIDFKPGYRQYTYNSYSSNGLCHKIYLHLFNMSFES